MSAWGKPPFPPPGHLSTILTISPISIPPWWSSPPPISRALYQKAVAENIRLTSLERLYLLSRLDLPGKALACPEELMEEQRDFLLGRPPAKVLAANIQRLFPIAASDHQLTTVAEVVSTFKDCERLATLGYEALTCVSVGWWTMEQDRAPAPWEDWDLHTDDPGVLAAIALLQKMRPEEAAFEDVVRERFSRSEMMWGMEGGEDAEEDQAPLAPMLERAEGHVTEAAGLREILREEVRVRVEGLGEEDKMALEKLRESMVVEIQKEKEEDEKREEEVEEERKRKASEEVEEKRQERARKASGNGTYNDEDYGLGILVIDE